MIMSEVQKSNGKRKISILGSTGSVGKQTLEVIDRYISSYDICALTANQNIIELKKQIEKYNPDFVAVMDKEKASELKTQLDIPVFSGIEGITKAATANETNVVVNSLVGNIGIIPTLEAIKKGKNIALANKEVLVSAGEIIMGEAKEREVQIIPIDSEHSAIMQSLIGEPLGSIKRIILTASGGAFRNYGINQLKKVTPKEAFNHPTWVMGRKITIDSATLMNKGFEAIEAKHLFNVPIERIETVMHPESIVHSLVELIDGSIKAQLSLPDMRIPIQYALSYPKRYENNYPKMDILKIKQLNFRSLDYDKFPCITYAYEAARVGGTMPAVLSAANDAAVDLFMKEKIGFMDICRIVLENIRYHSPITDPSIRDILDTQQEITAKVMKEHS